MRFEKLFCSLKNCYSFNQRHHNFQKLSPQSRVKPKPRRNFCGSLRTEPERVFRISQRKRVSQRVLLPLQVCKLAFSRLQLWLTFLLTQRLSVYYCCFRFTNLCFPTATFANIFAYAKAQRVLLWLSVRKLAFSECDFR